jgi:hypothetical protein
MSAPVLTIPLYMQFPYKEKVFKKSIGKICSNIASQSIAAECFPKSLLVNPRTNTNAIFETRTISTSKKFQVVELVAKTFMEIPSSIVINGVPIDYIHYKPLEETSYLVHIANTYKIQERKVLDAQMEEIKKINSSIISIYVSSTIITVLSNEKIPTISEQMMNSIVNLLLK